jgi:hypothetical protein
MVIRSSFATWQFQRYRQKLCFKDLREDELVDKTANVMNTSAEMLRSTYMAYSESKMITRPQCVKFIPFSMTNRLARLKALLRELYLVALIILVENRTFGKIIVPPSFIDFKYCFALTRNKGIRVYI